MTHFGASNGWLQRFQKRHSITFRAVSGESRDVDMSTVNTWKTSLDALLGDYDPNDIYNCDETGLFFRGMPDKTLAEKGDCCKGGKQAKERVSILLTVSATGKKEPPLVIWKSKMPRCFKGRVPSRIVWHHNKKAWMKTGKNYTFY